MLPATRIVLLLALLCGSSCTAVARSGMQLADGAWDLGEARVGDELWFAVRASRGGRTEELSVSLRAEGVRPVDDELSGARGRGLVAGVRLAARAADGRPAGSHAACHGQRALRDVAPLLEGLAEACRIGAEHEAGKELPARDAERLAAARTCLASALELLVALPVVQQMVRNAVRVPRLPGADAGMALRADFLAARPVSAAGPDGAAPVYEVPFALCLGEEVLLAGRALVTEPQGPLWLSAGIVAIEIGDSGAPAIRADLTAARRGAAAEGEAAERLAMLSPPRECVAVR